MNEETTEKQITLNDIFDELVKINKRLDAHDAQLEVIREGIVQNSARFDQLEAIALDGKSIALMTRSQLTILTEEVRHSKSLV